MAIDIKKALEKIDTLKAQIDKLRPISKELENKVMQKFRLDWNYHSNNIEGNQLTFGETKTFLLHGITANGKPLKDHLDIKGHNSAILLLEDIIKEDRPITENFIRELHEIILVEAYYKKAKTADGEITKRKIEVGKYKTTPNHVETATGEIFYFASPQETPALMNELINWYKNAIEEKKLHRTIIASLFHYKFIRIHPFDDGNGRLARILMNLILMKLGYPPIVIKTEAKSKYYIALQQADGGNELYFSKYICDQLITSLELFLKGAKGENIFDDKDDKKRFAILERRIETAVKAKTLKAEEFDDNIKELFEVSIRPLIINIYDKLSPFKKYFKKIEVQIFSSFTDFNLKNILETFKKEFKPQKQIKFEFKFNDFSFKDFHSFDSYCGFSVVVNRGSQTYKIELLETNFYIDNLVNKQLTNEEIDNIANLLKEKVLQRIEEEVENFENGV